MVLRMAAGEHRPLDEDYWESPWSTVLFAGDLFEAIPFGDQPTVLYSRDDEDPPHNHYLGEIDFGHGLLITPTCDIHDSTTKSLRPVDPDVRRAGAGIVTAELRPPARAWAAGA